MKTQKKTDYEYKNTAYVIINGEKVSTDDVEVLDISEDFSGRDLLTYKYKGKTYESYIICR